MDRVTFFLVALGVCAAFGGDYLVIDCHPPYTAAQYASAADLPRGGLSNRVYARDCLVFRKIPAVGQTFRMGNERAEADAMSRFRAAPQLAPRYFLSAWWLSFMATSSLLWPKKFARTPCGE